MESNIFGPPELVVLAASPFSAFSLRIHFSSFSRPFPAWRISSVAHQLAWNYYFWRSCAFWAATEIISAYFYDVSICEPFSLSFVFQDYEYFGLVFGCLLSGRFNHGQIAVILPAQNFPFGFLLAFGRTSIWSFINMGRFRAGVPLKIIK